MGEKEGRRGKSEERERKKVFALFEEKRKKKICNDIVFSEKLIFRK